MTSIRKKFTSPLVKVKGWHRTLRDQGPTSFHPVSLLCRTSILKVASRSNLVAAAAAIQPTFQTARSRTGKEKKIHSSPLTHTLCSHPLIRTGYKTTLSQKRSQDSKFLFKASQWPGKEIRVPPQGRQGESFLWKRHLSLLPTHPNFDFIDIVA